MFFRALLLLPAFAAAEGEFIIPGVDLSQVVLSPGSWCRYMVLDRALGIDDSTEVYIAIPSNRATPWGEAFWVEVESGPVGSAPAEREVFKLLVLEEVTNALPGDSLEKYILELYIGNGYDSIRAEDPARLRDFSLGSPTTDSSWNLTPGVKISTPAGDFSCLKKERFLNSEKEISAGRLKLIEKRDDRWTVWISEKVPIFHLVKCMIARSKETKTIPAVPGIPSSGRRESQTIAELIGFGTNAESIIPVGP